MNPYAPVAIFLAVAFVAAAAFCPSASVTKRLSFS